MTDENAMLALQAGDLDKASILFERYQQRLYNFFLKLTYDRDLSQDLTQNTFLRLLKYRKSYRNDTLFRAWLFQIARNVHKDAFKKQRGFQSQFTNLENVAEEATGYLQNVDEKEQERNLHRALSQLPEDDREILILSRFQKMSYEEIGAITGSSTGAVKVKAHRALKKLKGIYFMIEKR